MELVRAAHDILCRRVLGEDDQRALDGGQVQPLDFLDLGKIIAVHLRGDLVPALVFRVVQLQLIFRVLAGRSSRTSSWRRSAFAWTSRPRPRGTKRAPFHRRSASPTLTFATSSPAVLPGLVALVAASVNSSTLPFASSRSFCISVTACWITFSSGSPSTCGAVVVCLRSPADDLTAATPARLLYSLIFSKASCGPAGNPCRRP